MKRERRVLTGLAAVFLVELAIGIPAAFHRDVTDDAQATLRAVQSSLPHTLRRRICGSHSERSPSRRWHLVR